jgi:hypothetical protein
MYTDTHKLYLSTLLQSSDEEDFDPLKEKHRSRLHSNSRKPLTTTPINMYSKDDLIQDPDQGEENIPLNEQESLDEQSLRPRNVSECSGNESEIAYRKTTRLTAENLVRKAVYQSILFHPSYPIPSYPIHQSYLSFILSNLSISSIHPSHPSIPSIHPIHPSH